jgi:hypothetical protein
MRRLLVRRATLRIMGAPERRPGNGRPPDVEATAVDVDPDRLDPPR